MRRFLPTSRKRHGHSHTDKKEQNRQQYSQGKYGGFSKSNRANEAYFSFIVRCFCSDFVSGSVGAGRPVYSTDLLVRIHQTTRLKKACRDFLTNSRYQQSRGNAGEYNKTEGKMTIIVTVSQRQQE
eukprot:scaffold115410_cov23-Prasinocladus_malaysianus.AAC.1